MRTRVAAATLLLAPLASIACGTGGAGAAEDFLRMLPGRTGSAVYLDAAALREDGSPYAFRDAIRLILDNGELSPEYGVREGDLDYVAFARVDGGKLYVLGGLDDPDALRDELYVLDYDEGEVRDVEVWDGGRGDLEAFAFLPDGSVLASGQGDLIGEALRLRDRGVASLYDEFSEVFSSLLPGAALSIGRECGYPDADCLAAGFSARGGDSQRSGTRLAMEFRSERDAERGLESVEGDFGDMRCDVMKARQDGTLVTAEIVCDRPLVGEFLR